MKKSFVLESELYHLLEEVKAAANKSEDLIMIDYGDDFDFISKFQLEPTVPNRRELRLAIEIINEKYPLYKCADAATKADFVSDIFKFKTSPEKIENLKSFKQILYRTVITGVTEHNGKYIVKHKKVRKI